MLLPLIIVNMPMKKIITLFVHFTAMSYIIGTKGDSLWPPEEKVIADHLVHREVIGWLVVFFFEVPVPVLWSNIHPPKKKNRLGIEFPLERNNREQFSYIQSNIEFPLRWYYHFTNRTIRLWLYLMSTSNQARVSIPKASFTWERLFKGKGCVYCTGEFT